MYLPLRSFCNAIGHDELNEDILHCKLLLVYSHWFTKTLLQYKTRHVDQWARTQSSDINDYKIAAHFQQRY